MGCTSSQPSVVDQAQQAVQQASAARANTYAVKEGQEQAPGAAAAPSTPKSPAPTQQSGSTAQSASSPGKQGAPARKHSAKSPLGPDEGNKQQPIAPLAAPPKPTFSKLRTDCKVRDVYKLGKVIGTGGELHPVYCVACPKRVCSLHETAFMACPQVSR